MFLFLFSDSTLGNGISPIALEEQALLIVCVGGGQLLMQMQKGITLIITKQSKAFRRADEMQLEGKSVYKNVIL